MRSWFALVLLLPILAVAEDKKIPFQGLMVYGDDVIEMPPTKAEALTKAASAIRWAAEAEADDPITVAQFMKAFALIKQDQKAARQEFYRLIRNDKARYFKNEEHRLFFREAAALAFLRLSFGTCREELVLNVVRGTEGTHADPTRILLATQAGLWLHSVYDLPCL